MVGVMMEGSNMKPVPIPRIRRIFQQDTKNNNEDGLANNTKPVPLPRKFVQKIRTPEEILTVDDSVPVSDDAKRSTINIFKRGRTMEDPFEGFETELPSHESQLLSSVSFTSPLQDLRLSTISSSSSSTNQSDSSDYYDQPKSLKSLGSSKPKITTLLSLKEQQHIPKFQESTFPEADTSTDETAYSVPSSSSKLHSLQKEKNLVGSRYVASSLKSRDKDSIARNSESMTALYTLPLKNAEQKIIKPIQSNLETTTTSPITVEPVKHETNPPPPPLPLRIDSTPKKPERRYYSNVSFSPKFERAIIQDTTYEPIFPVKPKRVSISNGNASPASSASSLRSTPEPLLQPLYSHVRDELSHSSNSSSRTTSLPSLNSDYSSLRKIGTNRTSEGSNSSVLSASPNKKGSQYDEVAVEDGTIVFLDNQLYTKKKEDKKPRDSVVLEFDPLFKPFKSNTLPTIDTDDDSYEFVEPNPEVNRMGINSGIGNFTYSSTNLETRVPADVPTSDLPKNDVSSELDDDVNYEEVDYEKKEDDFMPNVVGVPLSNLKRSDASNGSFLRRLSNRMRLIPIREETPRGSSESLNSKCSNCFTEHSETAKCRYAPTFRSNVVYSSFLYRPVGIMQKEFNKKWAVLAKGKLTFYNEKSVPLEELSLERYVLISKKPDIQKGPGGVQLHSFELSSTGGKKDTLTFAGTNDDERSVWMQKWVESFTSLFTSRILNGFDRGGWGFIKESVTSDWHPSWMILNGRSLFYAFVAGDEFYELDLRKARSVTLSTKDLEQKCGFVDNSEVLTVDMITKILFIQTESPKVTSGWEKVICAAAKQNGIGFHEMQLTLDNVPVIVDKCIDFLYAHGTLAEGIYRQSGSNTRITHLLSEFQKDSWSVSISHKEFSVHDVAGTLKRFFRTLPQPLFTTELYDTWIAASKMGDESAQIDVYQKLLDSLPTINYNILKKLICHLNAVHEVHEKNLMPLNNLAPIWGPTLMNVESSVKLGGGSSTSESDEQYRSACAESEVVKDLIRNYYIVFRVDPASREKDRKMQDALENFHLGSSKRKCSGDMKMWIYVWEKDETNPVNITLTPQGTAQGIVHQLCRKAQLRNSDNLSLHEVICGKSLERPLHPSEIVIETVLRWSIWDIQERKDNYLILKKNTLYPALIPYAKDRMVVCGELKYADSKTKTLKKYPFEFSSAILRCFKDSKGNVELSSWKIEDIVWYMGSEPKRTQAPRWAFTFVKRNYPFKRSRDEPFFGNVISTGSEEELHRWLAAMVVGEHSSGLYPSVIV